MSISDLSSEEMALSLNGYDEIAVGQKFGSTPAALADSDPMAALRAMAFVHFRREGQSDAQAYESAMQLPTGEALEFFADDDEPMPEEPETDAGKGDSSAA